MGKCGVIDQDLLPRHSDRAGLNIDRFRRYVADHLSRPAYGIADDTHPSLPPSHSHEIGAEWLRRTVLPTLISAWQVLSDAGIGVRLQESYDPGHAPNAMPTIVFQCVGPLGRNAFGRLDQPKSDRFFFSCTGTHLILGRLAAYINSNAAHRVGEPEPIHSPKIPGLIAVTLETAVDHYAACASTD